MEVSTPRPMAQGGFYVFAPGAGGRLLGWADTWETALAQIHYHALYYKLDGKYRILPATGWEADAVGFGVSNVPAPGQPSQLFLPASAISVSPLNGFTFAVGRSGGLDHAVAVDYTVTTSVGTPTPVTGTITFEVGQGGAQTVVVAVAGITAAGTGAVTLSNARSVNGGPVPQVTIGTVPLALQAPVGLAWDTVIPKQIVTVGTPYSKNVNDWLTPDAPVIEVPNGLPAGFSFDPVTKELTAAANAPFPETGILFRASDVTTAVGPDAEFLAESSKPGVFYKNNFDFATRAELIASAAVVRYGYTGAGSGATPEDPIPVGAAEKVGLDFNTKLTGRASLRLRFRGSVENLTQAGPSYAGSFGGVGVKVEGPPKDIFFLRYVLRWNAAWMATVFPGTVCKQMTIFGINTGFSAGQQGLVTFNEDASIPGAWLVDGGGFKTFKNRYDGTLGLTGSNYGRHPFADAGPQAQGALTDQNSLAWFMRRHGYLQYTDGSVMADRANYPATLQANRDYVFLHKIDKVNDEVKVWVAEYGQRPFLFTGRMDAGISASAQYTGFQMLFRPDDGTNQVIPGGVDLEKHCDQIIGSTDVILFPGGHEPPYWRAGEKPPGYPYYGSYEVT